MAITLTSTQQVLLTLQAFDAANNPAMIENVVWTVSDPAILTVQVNETNPLAALAVVTGVLGVTQVVVTADARIGEGEVLLTGILDVTVISGEAVNITIVPGIPEEKPVPGFLGKKRK